VTETEVVRQNGGLSIEGEPTSIEQLIRIALDKNAPMESLEKLVTLYERIADRRAAQEFMADFAEFQAECPPIPKTSKSKKSTGVTTSGASFEYTYAELDEIASTVGPHLHKRGLSYTWDSGVAEGQVIATCTLRHRNGHSISAKFSAPIDASQRMNETQKYASALTYARRQSLVQVLGLTTTEVDTDVRPENLETISREQIDELRALLSDVRGDPVRFFQWIGRRTFEEMTLADYAKARRELEDQALKKRAKA